MKHQCEQCKSQVETDDLYTDESGDYCQPCIEAIHRQGAINAGIPVSVIDGKTKLTDHFSQSFIDKQTGKNKLR